MKPPEPTVQEVRQKQIVKEIQEIKQEKEEVEVNNKIDIDKFAKVIELQVQQELEKMRAKLQEGKKK